MKTELQTPRPLWKKTLLCLILVILLTAISGCLRGKIETEFVRCSMTPYPEEAKGVLWVATNKPIPVGLEGTDKLSMKDVGGWYLIHKRDLVELLRLAEGKGNVKSEE